MLPIAWPDKDMLGQLDLSLMCGDVVEASCVTLPCQGAEKKGIDLHRDQYKNTFCFFCPSKAANTRTSCGTPTRKKSILPFLLQLLSSKQSFTSLLLQWRFLLPLDLLVLCGKNYSVESGQDLEK